MRSVSPDEVKKVVLEAFADPLRARGYSLESVPDELDLLAEGVIDSLGILRMVSAVEATVGCELDLEDLPDEDVTIIGRFCRFVAEQSKARSGS
jgi:acyl carrier protein